MPTTHVAFGDESNWKVGRYGAVALVSAQREAAIQLHRRVAKLLKESGVGEFKWAKCKTAQYRFAGFKLVDAAPEAIAGQALRIDVIVWDTQDHRHAVIGRDDIANLQRMYYHLFKNVLSMRWPSSATWKLVPDQHSDMNWNDVHDILGSISRRHSGHVELSIEDTLKHSTFKDRLRKAFNVQEIAEGESKVMYVSQIADLFAGLACFARTSYHEFRNWLSGELGELSLFENEPDRTVGQAKVEKCRVLRHLVNGVRSFGLAVSFETSKGLRTKNPKCPLNFWWYESQSPHDQAPRRDRP